MKLCPQCNTAFEHTNWQCPDCGYQPKNLDGILAFAPDLALASDGFEAHFFDHLIALEAENFWFRGRNELIIWALTHYFPQGTNFLEVGCGTGYVLTGIERSRPTLQLQGSEIFTRGLLFAGQRLERATLFQMDARSIPFANEFDVIGAFDVLEHIQDDTRVLSEMYRATRHGLLLTVPQHPWLWSHADTYAHHFRRYSAQELRMKVERAGFRVIRMTSFVSLLLPLMLMSRLGQRKPKANYDPTAELRMSSRLNRLLGWVLTIERSLIKTGISWPMGGSLLLVAYKPKAKVV